MMAAAHRGHAGLDRLGRRVEIMVADRQHDDVLAGLLACHGGEMHLPAILAGRHDAGMREEGCGMLFMFDVLAMRSHVDRSSSLSFLRIPQRLVLLHGRLEALAEDLDLDLGAGHGQIGAQHAERDRFVDPVAQAA